MTLKQLQASVNDARIHISKCNLSNIKYHAEIVESNGDTFHLSQSSTVDGLASDLQSMGYIA